MDPLGTPVQIFKGGEFSPLKKTRSERYEWNHLHGTVLSTHLLSSVRKTSFVGCAICGVLLIALPIPIIVNNFNKFYEKSKIEEEINMKKNSLSWQEVKKGTGHSN